MTDQESIDILNSLIPPLNKVNLNHNVESTTTTTSTALKSNQNGTATDNEKAAAALGSNFSSGGGCPYFNGKVTTQSSGGLKKLPKNPEWQTSVSIASEPLSYSDYLHLDKVLNAQYPVSQKYGNLAHDEHLFIVIHQTYELWFKQIIFELDSVISLLAKPVVDDRCILVVVSRIQRINMIWKLLNDQIHILETMAPTDFIDFRGYLSTASGFQSLQFRVFENKLGLAESFRIKYNQLSYNHVFTDTESRESLNKSEQEPTLLKLINAWLERTPGLVSFDVNEKGTRVEYNYLLKEYEKSVHRYLKDTYVTPAEEEIDEAERKGLLDEYKKNLEAFATIFDEEKHNKLMERGERKLGHKALWGALFIWLNRDEPRFHLPYQLLYILTELDALINRWRYSHALLAQRQVGNKAGTGGSSGYSYLRSTASDRYKIFNDIVNLSTWLIPREYIPKIDEDVRRRLNSFTTFD